MGVIQPKGKKIRQAIEWISENLKEDNKRSLGKLIQETSLRYNLSPKEEAFLNAFYKEGSEAGSHFSE